MIYKKNHKIWGHKIPYRQQRCSFFKDFTLDQNDLFHTYAYSICFVSFLNTNKYYFVFPKYLFNI